VFPKRRILTISLKIMDAVELQILGLGGPVCTIAAERTWSVRALKTKIQEISNILEDDQGLFFGSSELKNGELLSNVLPAEEKLELALLRRESAIPEMLRNPNKLLEASRSVVMACLARHGQLLGYIKQTYGNDVEVVLTAIEQEPYALQHAGENLKNDPEVVKAAIRREGNCLQFASAALRNDIDIVLEAVRRTGAAIDHADRDLQKHQRWREVVLAAVRSNGEVLQSLPTSWKKDREIVLVVAEHWPHAVRYASAELRTDREVQVVINKGHI
jgi:hypothetical protein